MFSVDPEVYGQGVDLVASADRIEAQLAAQIERLADRTVPPFTPALTRSLRKEIAAVRAEARRLGQISNRFFVEQAGQLQAQGRFHRLNRHLRGLETALDALEVTLKAGGQPLLPPHHHPGGPPDHPEMERLFERLHLALTPEVPLLTRGEWHGDIPLPMGRFIALMQAAVRLLRAMDRPDPWSFLDVGCGLGLKVLAAQEFFGQTTGIELDARRATVARRLVRLAARNRVLAQDTPTPWVTGTLPPARARIEAADALTWEGYGAFDVIYAYRPIFDTDLMTQLDRRMIAQARPGTLILAPYGDFATRGGAEGMVALNEFIFLKPAPGPEPEDILRRAADIGPLRPVPPFGGYGDEGLSAPLNAALRRWGHLS